ncbi:MAG: T9SS type A sorting domain-containing protein [Saprospiraceae bacterium]|nr:T9SS type A sorting domain-containing protein [Saprospiraceae bacterium]
MKNWLQKFFLLTAAFLFINFAAVGQTCDTLSNFSGNYAPAIIPVPSPGWGYVSGHNNYLDVAKAESYNYTGTNTHVQGVIMAFGYAFTVNPLATITATIWDGTGGTPGAVVEQKDVLIQDIMLSISMFQAYYAEFDEPVALPGSQFFVGFTMTTGTDTVAVVTSTPGNVFPGQGTAWEQQATNSWFNYNSPSSWGFDATHAMFPVLVTPTEAIFTPSNVTACQNVNITFDGTNSVDAITYEWIMPGATPSTSTMSNPTVTYSAAGTYDVTLIVTNGCMSDTLTRSGIIEIANYCPPTCDLATTIAATSPSCFGGNDAFATTQTTGGIAPYTYAWSSGATTDTAFTLTTGNYTVTITDANGCFVIASFGIGNPQQLAATGATTAPTTCNGTNGTATAVATGGNGIYTYAWNTMPMQTTATATNLGQGNYACTITDGNGCTTVIGVSVSDGCGGCTLALNTIITNASCNLQNGSINPNVTGQNGAVTYAWSNGATTPFISGLAAGTYSVTVTDASNCTDSTTVVLVQSGIVTVTMNPTDNFCSAIGASINTSIAGGATPYIYTWSNGATTNSINNLMTGNYSVTVTDANGCTANSTVSVTSIANGPSVTTTQGNVTCFGAHNGTVNMTITGGNLPYAVFWSPLNISAQNLNSLAAGTYTAVVADQAGCLATTTVVITQPDSITLVGTSTPTLGSSGTAIVNAAGGTPPYSYAWNNGGSTQSIQNLVIGTYTVTVTDVNNCSSTTSITVQDFTSNTNNIEALTNFEVFPNPSSGEFMVRLDFSETTDIQIRVLNIVGQPIMEINETDNALNLPINLTEQPSGMYFIMIQTENGRAIKRVMITK